MVPELTVTDIDASLRFWVTLCGFEVLYDRPEKNFAYLRFGTAELMLDQVGVGRSWLTGDLEAPLGRGVNFQVSVPTIAPLLDRLAAADWPLFLAAEEKWYRTGNTETGVEQFLVQDPDGYLARFSSRLGQRPASTSS